MDGLDKVPLRAGEAVGSAETASLGLMVKPAYRVRTRHPVWFGLIAFVIGGGFVGLFIMSAYGNWVYEGIDLERALYQVIFGSLGGGIVMVILAFAFVATLKPAIAPMEKAGLLDP